MKAIKHAVNFIFNNAIELSLSILLFNVSIFIFIASHNIFTNGNCV